MDLLEAAKNSICPTGVSPETLRGKTVLAAVSGGVDSMVMLDVLHRLSGALGFALRVITVNHNIRPEEETSGDAELVADVCAAYGIPCSVRVLRRGLVAEVSLERGKGTEEAARFLRYEAFEQEARSIGAAVVCIAHNRNDRLETILQRFLQGAGVLSAPGMRQHRGIYARPLFDVPREAIEVYAAQNGVRFRTDATNADNTYFRNRIRNKLIPFLNEIEPGWDSAVIHGAEKNSAAADDINKAIEKIRWTRESSSVLRMSAADFESCSFTARAAIIYDGLSLLKCPKRIPYSMIASFSEGARKVTGAGVVMERKHDSVFLTFSGSRGNEMSDSGFFVFVERPGRFIVGDESVTVRRATETRVSLVADEGAAISPGTKDTELCDAAGDSTCALYVAENDDGCVSGAFKLPVVIRSGTSSDSFRTAGGERKLLSKIFSEWHVPSGKRSLIPVFEDEEDRGVWGSLFGYPDWFVKIE
jgi:tRNA(Ile)-lysidine synthase